MKAFYGHVAVGGRRVLVREDLNVPMTGGVISDDTRIRAALPTIWHLVDRGARVVVMSHLGRPRGRVVPELSLAPVARRMTELMGTEVRLAPDCVGDAAGRAVAELKGGQVLLLENVRFHAGDEANDPAFAAQLAELGDIYINDAFAVSHRAHASVVGVARLLPAYAGDLMMAELTALHRALDHPSRPLVAIVGGAKVSTKVGVLKNLLTRVDRLLIGGAMANTFLKAGGLELGASLVEDGALNQAREVAELGGDRLLLPLDAVLGRRGDRGWETRVAPLDAVEPGWSVLDIGPRTRSLFAAQVAGAGTVVWNGPLGMFEQRPFGDGTLALGRAVAASGAFSLLGGGDTAAAVAALGLSGSFSFVSTGGGATLESLEGRELPGVAVLAEVVA